MQLIKRNTEAWNSLRKENIALVFCLIQVFVFFPPFTLMFVLHPMTCPILFGKLVGI